MQRRGELLEYLGRDDEALVSYRRGKAFKRAMDLARMHFPAYVVEIEEEWGDYLREHNQVRARASVLGYHHHQQQQKRLPRLPSSAVTVCV